MRRGKQLIGMPVIAMDTGKRLALVQSLLFDPESGRLVALVLQKGSLLAEKKAIKVEQLHAIGRDAVIMSAGQNPLPLSAIQRELPGALSEEQIAGRPVLTTDGQMLGTLADLEIDQDSGRITQLILSDGLIQDLIGGYSAIPAPEGAVYGDEHIILPESAFESG